MAGGAKKMSPNKIKIIELNPNLKDFSLFDEDANTYFVKCEVTGRIFRLPKASTSIEYMEEI